MFDKLFWYSIVNNKSFNSSYFFNKYVPLIREDDHYSSEEIRMYVDALENRTKLKSEEEWQEYRKKILY
ncbi:hypothetical protein ES705_45391 [subsurface metagenome]